jgi:hypothetical protein
MKLCLTWILPDLGHSPVCYCGVPKVASEGEKQMTRSFAVAPLAILLIAAMSSVGTRPVSAADEKGYAGFEKWVLQYGVSETAAIDPGFRKAKHDLDEALQKHDKKAVAALLNENFQWVNSSGDQHTKAQVLENPDELASNNEGALDVRTTDFRGDVVRLIGIHRNERFVHLWAKSNGAWTAFAFLDIPLPKERSLDVDPPVAPKDPDAPCINPCKTVGDFKPADAKQAEALRVWMILKNSEWHPNGDVWGSHSDVYHETITADMDMPMLQHVAQLSYAQKLYPGKSVGPGEPVMQMKMFTFNNVVIQENLQGKGTKPVTWIMRVFVNRGDDAHPDWKICLSAQTKIKKNLESQSAAKE